MCSCRVYTLRTLPLKISIDIIMKSIRETNASPKKLNTRREKERNVWQRRREEVEEKKEKENEPKRWRKMNVYGKRRRFSIYILFISSLFQNILVFRCRECARLLLQTSCIINTQPKSTHAQRPIFLFSFHFFSVLICAHSTTTTETAVAASTPTKRRR